MRIRENAIFPHPILKEYATDYGEGIISFSIQREYLNDQDFILKTNTEVHQKYLEEMIKNKKIIVAVDIECQPTYFSDLIPINLGDYELPPFLDNDFIGRLDIRLLLYSKEVIPDFFTPDFHSDFGEEKFSIRKGEILGFSELNTFDFEYPKISYEQIFELRQAADHIRVNEFDIMMEEDEKIVILAGSDIFSKLMDARSSDWGKNLNLLSVISMSLLQVIIAITNNPEIYKKRSWYAVLDETISAHGYNLNDPDDLVPLRVAQHIFDFPFNNSYQNIKECINKS